MSETPKVGFISLGCPKALVDSERILTQLRTDGYEIVPSYEDAGLVVVNTCGFIDSAVEESLESIEEAMDANGKVIVTGCLGVKADEIKQEFPKVLAVTGPQAYSEVVSAVHANLPKPAHNPYVDLVPPQGIKLTPKHYAYLKISEGCNHKCTFCIIPSMRGKLVSRDAGELGSEVAADILDFLADAHMRLSEGQGAELFWRDSGQKRLTPIDALKIYALKTSPAFEAAMYTGIRLAGPIDEYQKPIKDFARNLGVAFQILNDLKDWEGDSDNKMAAGGDLLAGRPTLLWALALEGLDEAQQAELYSLLDDDAHPHFRLSKARQLYQQANVFEKASLLVDKYQEKAEIIADDIEPDSLRRLLYYLVDTVLSRSTGSIVPTIEFAEPTMNDALPIVAH